MATSLQMPSDATLLAAAREHPEAFRSLYERYAERVHGYFLRRTRDRTAAEDLTAETFARAWIHRDRFVADPDGSAAPWLFGIARNVLLMSLRRGAVERRAADLLGIRERLDAPDLSHEPIPAPWWADGADELLDTLTPAQRDAVRLRVIDDLDYDQIAGELDISEQAARVRVHRGLAALRTRLSSSNDRA
ncbi:MAG: sigma-70 family RNA polymerase sigma factor [Solirubrobacteraceae bacterium]|nr:sigma-70 family RNA polymerase sigma factor [Patulibacter sp.]